jgi:hypothetical protein
VASVLLVLARGTGDMFEVDAGLKSLSFEKANECVREEAKPASIPDVEAGVGGVGAETIVLLPIVVFSFSGDVTVVGAWMVTVGPEGVAVALLLDSVDAGGGMVAVEAEGVAAALLSDGIDAALEPQSTASMAVLRSFHTWNLQGQISLTDFYCGLEQITCGDGLLSVPVSIYLSVD